VRASLARSHRWTGADCAEAGRARAAERLRSSPAPPRATGSSSTSPGSCRRAPA
jgi:hypothetical protein